MRYRRVAAVAAAAMATLAIAGAGVPALAADDAGTVRALSHGPVRMWEDPRYSGSLYVEYYPGQAPNNKVNIGGWNGDNEISSVKNDTDYWVVLWDNDDYTGSKVCLRPHEWAQQLSWDVFRFDNKAESFQLTTSSLC